MQTYHYFLGLCVLATLGFALAMHQDMKPSTKRTAKRWCVWMLIMAFLIAGDFVLMRAFTPS